MVTLLIVGTTGVVFADEAETSTEPEKELALYNADGDINGDGEEDYWVGLKFINKNKETCIEISYSNKSLTSLVDEGYTVEIRYYYEYPSQIVKGAWYNIDKVNILPGDEKDLFVFSYTENTANTYRFRIIGKDGSLISISDKFVIDPDITFPVLISSNPISYDLYDFDGKSIKVSLKYNDTLALKDPNKKASIDISKFDRISTDSPFFVTNLEYNNQHLDKIHINGKDYDYNYCIVTYNCTFSKYDLTNINSDQTYANYYYKLKNLVGENYNEEPYEFFFRIFSYKDNSLNPQKKLTIKEHHNRIEVNETVNLNVDILSDEISKDNLIWVSSDENIATVDENGIVTATGLGKAYIYATEENTDELYDYSIIDVVMPVSNISLDISTLSLKTGAEHQLIPTVEPEGADKTVTWTSSNENVATVDENGIVTAKKAGSAVITVTSNYDPNISRNCNIIVSDPIQKIESIKLKGLPGRIKVGSRFKLTAITSPSNATNKKVTWKSSNTKYATVTSSGTVSIKSAGAGKTVKITATAKDGSGIKKTVTFNIEKIKVTKIKLKASNTVVAGKTVKIKAIITPSNATNKKVTWKSSNKKYATVNSKGIVTTKKAGKGKVVKITAISKDNSKIKATIKIKIK